MKKELKEKLMKVKFHCRQINTMKMNITDIQNWIIENEYELHELEFDEDDISIIFYHINLKLGMNTARAYMEFYISWQELESRYGMKDFNVECVHGNKPYGSTKSELDYLFDRTMILREWNLKELLDE